MWESKREKDGISVAGIQEVTLGMSSAVLRKSGTPRHADRYLSIVTSERSVDMEFSTPEQPRAVKKALEYVAEFQH